MNIVIKTLGCKANRYESDRLSEIFSQNHCVSDTQACNCIKANIVIINTCTVTHVADRKSRQAVSHLKSLYPQAKIIVFGCGANVDKENYKKLDNVDYVIQKRADLYKLISVLTEKSLKTGHKQNLSQNRTRALVKIQDGCNNFCTYCIIPYARGRQKSRSSDEIIDEINDKFSKNYKEIVLTGINIGEWEEKGLDLADLIRRILNETKIPRLRLSSIEPQNFSKKFLKLFENEHFCRHLHISLQSGSDTILKTMRRRYNCSEYSAMIEKLRTSAPDISITTDVIVGFPGETKELFEETFKYVKRIGFSKIHIFPYSKRKGTLAATMPNQIPYKVKKDRCRQLNVLEKEMRKNFHKDNIGKISQILIESKNKDNSFSGFTSNYIKTRIKSKRPLKTNTIAEVQLKELNNETLEVIGTI